MNRTTYLVPARHKGTRLDVALADLEPAISRSQAGALIREKRVAVTLPSGLPAAKLKPGLALDGGETIVLDRPDPEPLSAAPEDIPLDIRYEDDDLIVVNKPAGMVVHPAPGHAHGTLVNALAAHSERLSTVGGPFRPGIVHRLDRDTSGLLIVAKNDRAHRNLSAQLADRTLTRQYLALVWGHPDPADGMIDAPIGRNRADGKTMAIEGRAQRDAVTHYETLEEYRFTAWLRISLETGRTHQIRVHLRYIGHPVVGDPDYSGRSAAKGVTPALYPAARRLTAAIDRQALHAARLSFWHPVSGEQITVESELPEDLARAKELAAAG